MSDTVTVTTGAELADIAERAAAELRAIAIAAAELHHRAANVSSVLGYGDAAALCEASAVAYHFTATATDLIRLAKRLEEA
jgi:hypothetical protein